MKSKDILEQLNLNSYFQYKLLQFRQSIKDDRYSKLRKIEDLEYDVVNIRSY